MIASLNIQKQWAKNSKTSIENEFGDILSELDDALSPIELCEAEDETSYRNSLLQDRKIKRLNSNTFLVSDRSDSSFSYKFNIDIDNQSTGIDILV